MSYGSTPPPPSGPPPSGPPPSPQYGAQPYTAYGQLAQWPTRALGYLADLALYIPGFILMVIGAPKTVTVRTPSGFTSSTTGWPTLVGGLGLVLDYRRLHLEPVHRGRQGPDRRSQGRRRHPDQRAGAAARHGPGFRA